MSTSRRRGMALAVGIIGLGVGWMLDVYQVLPDVNWIWTGGLGLAGILILALSGLNQFSVLTGPFLIVAAVLSLLRQTGRLRLDLEAPILVIAFGICLLVSHAPSLPSPDFLKEAPKDGRANEGS